MSAPTAGLPRTSARAIGIATLLGVFALAAYEPMVVAGVFTGAAVAAAAAASLDRRSRALPAALLSVGVLGGIGVVYFAAGAPASSFWLTTAAVPLGAGLSVVLLGGGSTEQLREASTASLYAAAVATGATAVATAVHTAGGPGAALEASLWLSGPGVVGLAAGFVLTGVVLVGGIVAVPPASLTTPGNRSDVVAAQKTLGLAAVFASLVGVGLLVVLLVLGAFLPALDVLLEWLVGSVLVRAVLLVVAGVGVALAAVGLVARLSWTSTSEGRDPALVVLAGSVCGFLASFPALVVAGPPTTEEWAAIYTAATLVFGVGWIALRVYAEQLERELAPTAPTMVALGLGTSGAIIATDVAYAGEPATGVVGLSALVAVAAGVFVFKAGRFAELLGTEVGRAGTTRRPQLVRLGWFGAVTLLGLVVAVAGLWVATVFAPTLSVPAAAGVLLGSVAVLAGLWLVLGDG
jgi:hypothetical protein